MNRARPLRLRLFLLAASGLLPLAVVAGLVLGYVMDQRQRDAQQAALEVSRALATAVEADLRATIGVLQGLSLSSELQSGPAADFREVAHRVASGQGWLAVVLADASGRVLLDSADPSPGGGAGTRPVDPDSMTAAVALRWPTVGRVAPGPQGRPSFAVRVPVLRDGQPAYILSAVVPVERMRNLLTLQGIAEPWVVAIFDQTGTIVARSLASSAQRASPSMQALIDRGGNQGSGVTYTLEGVRSHSAFTRLRNSRWVVAAGVSAEEANRGLWGVLGAIGAGLLASLGFAAFLAWYFARGVTEPIDRLKEAAAALGRGEPMKPLPPMDIAELQEVSTALQSASREREIATRERLVAEAERETLLERATTALKSAEEAARSKDEFLAMLGHELRNPLAPMATALHLMARKGDERTRAERQVMERQVAHMKRLVDDLLDVSRITGKRLAMRMEPLCLAEVVRHAAQGVQPVLDQRRFRVDIPPECEDLWVCGDEVRLGQVLANLLGNAVKFTRADDTIVLRLRHDDEMAEVQVEDDGDGMPPAVLERVFDLFYQAPQEADRSRGGLGLGLAIVRSLVEMHGGTVQAHSEGPGHGSLFVMRLPLVEPPRASAPVPLAPAAGGAQARVLVVDDNQDAADTAAALLELNGYDVKVAYGPEAALELLAAFRPAVVLLDIGLPGMSGYELAARMRADPVGQGAWLVALTGYGTQADVQRALDAGFNQHLVKPASPQALLQAVEAGLARG